MDVEQDEWSRRRKQTKMRRTEICRWREDRRQYPSSACKTVSSAAEIGDYMSGWCKCTKKARSESTYDSAKKEGMSAEALCGEETGGWDGLVSLHRRSAFIVIVGAFIFLLRHRPSGRTPIERHRIVANEDSVTCTKRPSTTKQD